MRYKTVQEIRESELKRKIQLILDHDQKWFSVIMVAGLLDKSRSQIYRYIDAGVLSAEKTSTRGLRIPKQALIDYLAQWSN